MADPWTFPEGMVGHADSVKGYRVEGSDGRPAGEVAWADYKPGDSYLVVAAGKKRHHVVPAGAITAVDHAARRLTLAVTAAAVLETPVHEEAETAYAAASTDYVDQFERGMIGGGFVWPYTDV